MLSADRREEAERQFTVCNACRYCEGYCAVFPAMELRRHFTAGDVEYIANLCHDCRDCYYACQYAPPHEFAIDIPQLLATVRTETYGGYAPAPAGAAAASGSAWTAPWLGLAALAVGIALTWAISGVSTLVTPRLGPGAFYAVVPAPVMEIVFSALGLFWLIAWIVSGARFWRAAAVPPRPGRGAAALLHAAGDALKLTYLGGGGAGCTYPDAAPSGTRRILHHLVFYGFVGDLVSTSIAAFDDHVLGIVAPYPLLSPVVVAGTLGGLAILVGIVGLMLLKVRSDRDPASPVLLRLDKAFSVSLLLVVVTGLLLMALRSTAAMGILLLVHLATVFALFVSAPYGKFAHLVYRYVSLVRYARERDQGHAP